MKENDMTNKNINTHPYIPNMDPKVQQVMLDEIGIKSTDELFEVIPEELHFKGKLNIPSALDEHRLRRHIETMLANNQSSNEMINFLGAGCWQHFVPAVCDEVNQRAEFLNDYAGKTYEDFGRWQALFEYQSLIGELVGMDFVNNPMYDWAQAAATSIRMAGRMTGRTEVLLPQTMSTEKFMIIKNYCSPDINCIQIKYEQETGKLNIKDLQAKVSNNTAAIYFENPSFLGFIEDQGEQISEIAHQNGAISIVGVDPSSLGLLAPPVDYGADIVCGELQPLGMHMNYGGGQAGFIATRDEEKYVQEYPSRLFGIAPTSKGEYGFGDILMSRTSLHNRTNSKEFVGTQTALWGITAGVYLSLLGPEGMSDLGETILQKNHYTMKHLSRIPGVIAPTFETAHFKEFVVDFNDTGKTVKEINRHLYQQGILGGKDLSESFPELGQSALYCVTEVHSKENIDKLVNAVNDCVQNGGFRR